MKEVLDHHPDVVNNALEAISLFEWISTEDMHKAVEVIIELCKVWEEKTP